MFSRLCPCAICYNGCVNMPLPSSLNLSLGGAFVLALVVCGSGCALGLKLHRAQPSFDWLEFGFVVIVLGLTLALWLGLILASIGLFSLITLSAVLIVLGIGGWLIARSSLRRATNPAPGIIRSTRLDVALIGVLIIGSVFYLRPHEFIFGGADAGVYVNMGAHIARTGSLLVHDDEVARLDPAAYPDVFREQPKDFLTRYYQFPGFYVSDSQAGVIIPQFFAPQAVAIAIFTSIGGVPAGLMATPLWGLLGLAAIYFFTRSLFGRRAALLAAIMLAANPTQIWFARYPTAEVLTQASLFFGLYALSRLLKQYAPSIGWGLLAGFWIGLIFLVRIDMILVAVVMLAAVVAWIAARQWHAGLTALAIALGVMSAYMVMHALVFAWPYTWNTYSAVFRVLFGSRWPVWIVLGVIGLIGIIVGLRRANRLSVERRSLIARWLRISLIVIVIAAAGYAYFIRPYREAPTTTTNWYDAQSVIATNYENLVRIGWYITPIGLGLALIGLCLMLWRERSGAVNLFVAIGLLSTIVYVINILNNPHQIYASRRYVPVVMPALSVWGAYGLVVISRARRRLMSAVVVIAAIAWLGGMIVQARLIGVQVDDAGTVSAFAEFDRRLESDAVVLMNDQSVVGFGDIVGTPLRYIFNHPVFVLRTNDAWSSDWLKIAVRDWQQRGKQVYVISNAATDLTSNAALPLEPRGQFAFETTVLEPTYTQFPDRVVPVRYDLKVDAVAKVK